ncbi:WD40-repeat-containing domain protein [Paraphoma chrysanthemicola]|uniref:WD40-repeat-containing domain protein n=1 Tax=Paraphoma chrysanthemicola TaxID=798071 RepID=A0A8K0R9G8_9PLEO|nr:WD40-repeat-containing domain protein [Paraphoma chrysanthemicola]
MRLLRRIHGGGFSFTDIIVDEATLPPYAILSHTWGEDAEEVTFKDIASRTGETKSGYKKILFCDKQVEQDGLEYFWVDTCCIDKSDKAELSHAIRSMFRYGTLAEFTWEPAFRLSRWFTRGWTLQELLAPSIVEFFSDEWERLSDKISLKSLIHKITSIPHEVLDGAPLSQFDYSLSGIFSVEIAPAYSEGAASAFRRLMDKIHKQEKCIQDMRITDPRNDKKRIQEIKGGLLADSYRDPSKGKTMLLCGIIDELQSSMPRNSLLSYFFCQETDSRINSATAALRGLLYMLVSQQPLLASHVLKKYSHAGKNMFKDANSWVALTEIFVEVLQDPRLHATYIIIDALDECAIDRPKLLAQLERAEHKVSLSLKLNAKSITAAVNSFIHQKVDHLAQEKQYKAEIQHAVALVCQDLRKTANRHVLRKLGFFPPRLDSLYKRMIHQMGESDDAEICRCVLASTAVLYRPVTIAELVALVEHLEDVSDDVREIVSLCGSFLTLRDDTVYFVHQSAKDFLLTKAVDKIFPDGTEDAHQIVFSKSLAILSGTLRRDMYSLGALGFPIDDVEPPRPDPLAASRYSCVYWIDHLHDSKRGSSVLDAPHIRDMVNEFLRKKYIYWLEGLSLCKSLGRGVVSMGKLCSLVQDTQAPDQLTQLVQDARRFIMYHKGAIKSYPLQAYASAFLFSPSHSLIRSLFRHEEPDWITLKPAMSHKWSDCTQTLEGHFGFVDSVALSYDSVQLASGSRDGKVIIWDVASGEHLQTLKGSAPVRSVAFSHDSTWLASASYDSTITIWDTCNGDCLQTIGGHTKAVLSVAFSHDSTHLASSSYDGTIMIWDIHNHEHFTLEGHADFVWCIAYSHNSTQLASASRDHTVKIWDVSSRECLQTLQGHTDWVMSVTFSHDSTLLASASGDCSVKIWSVGMDRCQITLEGHTAAVLSVTFSYDSTRLVSASADHTIKIWDVSTGRCLHSLEGHTGAVNSVALSDNSTWLVSASEDRTIKFWDWSEDECTPIRKRHEWGIRLITVSHDETQLASASDDGLIKTWNADTGECRYLHGSNNDNIRALVFSHNSSRLASVSYHTVKLWDLTFGNCLHTLKGHGEEVSSVAFSHDSTRLASTSLDSNIKVWDVGSGECLQTLKLEGSRICSITFSHDSTQIASADHTIRIWDTRTNKCLGILKGDEKSDGMITALAFSHNSCQLASSSGAGFIKIWEVASGNCLQAILIGRVIYNLRFSPTSSHLMTDYGVIAVVTAIPPSLTQNAPTALKAVYCGGGLSIDSNWITYDSENIVWIPTEFRRSCSVTAGKFCAAGADSGNVWICHFDRESR